MVCAHFVKIKKHILNHNQIKRLPHIRESKIGSGYVFENEKDILEYDKFGEIFAGSITDESVENKEYQYYDLGIKCINCKENSYTLPPHIIYIKGNGIIDFQGKCCIYKTCGIE